MKAIRIGSTLMAILLFLTLSDIPAVGLRCGVRLISVGDPKSKVLAQCGEPESIEVWEEERVYRYYYLPEYDEQNRDAYRQPRFAREYVTIEEWIYNHGRYRFMDHVRFEKGRVKKIISGDYGY